jgi:hypothetical protein
MKYTVKVYKKILETEVEAESLISARHEVQEILDKDKDFILRVSIPTPKEEPSEMFILSGKLFCRHNNPDSGKPHFKPSGSSLTGPTCLAGPHFDKPTAAGQMNMAAQIITDGIHQVGIKACQGFGLEPPTREQTIRAINKVIEENANK